MEIKRFFAEEKISGNNVIITGDEFYHAVKVLRLKVGYIICVCDNSDNEYIAVIEKIDKESLTAKITEVHSVSTENNYNLHLFQALPKKAQAEFIVQKSVELGFNKVTFFYSDYTNEKEFNFDRFNKIAKDASKQCKRGKLMKIGNILSFDEMLNEIAKFPKIIFAYEKENSQTISDISFKNINNIALIVGSEGGFSEIERDKIKNSGGEVVSLGKRILRVETAVVALGTLVQYRAAEDNK